MGPNGSRRDETSCSAFSRAGFGAGGRLYRFARPFQRLDFDWRRRLTIGHDHARDGYRCRNAGA